MTAHGEAAARALARLWPDGSARVIRPLGDGPTNATWLVTHGDAQGVLRLTKPLAAALGLDLRAELMIVAAAATAGLAPPILRTEPTEGIVLSQFLPGRGWSPSDFQQPRQVQRLARTLRAVHRVRCTARPFDVAAALAHYADLLDEPQARDWARAARAQIGAITPRPRVLCHNDPIAVNLVDDGQLRLLDWEYAALGDPLFDLAVIVGHHHLDTDASDRLLYAYLGRGDAEARADMARWHAVYGRLVALWLSVLERADADALTPAQRQQLQRLRENL